MLGLPSLDLPQTAQSRPTADQPAMAAPVELAVVLITRNQAWNVARLIESVLEHTACVATREIVLVDSDSSDRTLEIAQAYPITLVKLSPAQRLTAAAGRYVGGLVTRGTFVLFLDGDMELCSGWLEQALLTFQQTPDIAVVSGPWINVPPDVSDAHKQAFVQICQTNQATDTVNDLARYHASELSWSHLPGQTVEVRLVGGAALYRRAVLDRVGSFNPFLYSDEEPELCMRIRRAGYRLVRLGDPIALHYSRPPKQLSTFWRRHQHNLYLGHGQNLRYYLGQDLFWTYLKERGQGCLIGVALLAGFVSFVFALITHHWLLFALWGLVVLTAFGVTVIHKRSFRRAVNSMVLRLFMLNGTIRGFLLRPLDARRYRDDFVVVRRMDGKR